MNYERALPPPGITGRLTVNETMARYPAAIAAMRGYGIEPGCSGGLTLAAVAERNNLNLDRLLETLRAAAAG